MSKIVPTGLAASVQAMVDACHGASVAGGWWTDLDTGESLAGRRNVGELLMLIVSEIAEAMEGHRKGLKDTHLPDRPMVEVELADALIRIADLGGALGLDLGGALVAKLEYNACRADHRPENRRLAGGKRY
jgi:NTP pyrophosphatase (non-canonical NTP hydrolase)